MIIRAYWTKKDERIDTARDSSSSSSSSSSSRKGSLTCFITGVLLNRSKAENIIISIRSQRSLQIHKSSQHIL